MHILRTASRFFPVDRDTKILNVPADYTSYQLPGGSIVHLNRYSIGKQEWAMGFDHRTNTLVISD